MSDDLDLDARLTSLELAVTSLATVILSGQDGHPFYGNQWTSGGGGDRKATRDMVDRETKRTSKETPGDALAKVNAAHERAKERMSDAEHEMKRLEREHDPDSGKKYYDTPAFIKADREYRKAEVEALQTRNYEGLSNRQLGRAVSDLQNTYDRLRFGAGDEGYPRGYKSGIEKALNIAAAEREARLKPEAQESPDYYAAPATQRRYRD